MSWRDNLTEAQARLDALESAELKILAGEQVRLIQYDGERLEYQQPASLAEVRRAITEVRMYVTRLSGGRFGGAIIPIMGR